MACKGCTVGAGDGGCSSGGCGRGGCASGGCNKLNTYDWITATGLSDIEPFGIYEVSINNGASKEYCFTDKGLVINTGDFVVIDTGSGYDVGKVSLSGELVRLQLKKKRITEKKIVSKIVRLAHAKDLERLDEARQIEKQALVKSRVIARSLGLDMKIGDVHYQADLRKATFYFTSDGRVDFRELIRHYAKEFRVKIEMKQIGARQESARIGGIGSCGRELCCSTWLTDFKSVATTAARYQNLAINQAKLSGQCGRLKCCLNYELDMYIDALKHFPPDNKTLKFEKGKAHHIKTDIFKKIMYYSYEPEQGRGSIIAMEKDQVAAIIKMNESGQFPSDPDALKFKFVDESKEEIIDYEDVTGAIELPSESKKKRKKKKKKTGINPMDLSAPKQEESQANLSSQKPIAQDASPIKPSTKSSKKRKKFKKNRPNHGDQNKPE